MTEWLTVFATVIGGIVGYCILLNRAAHFVQPLRKRLARRGEHLLSNPYLSKTEEESVRFFLDNAFNGRLMFWGVFLVPIAMPFGFFSRRDDDRDRPESFFSEFGAFTNMTFISLFAANPFCGLIVAVEMLLLIIVMMLAGGTVGTLKMTIQAFVGRVGPGDGFRFGH
jgi:hypothetical protein